MDEETQFSRVLNPIEQGENIVLKPVTVNLDEIASIMLDHAVSQSVDLYGPNVREVIVNVHVEMKCRALSSALSNQ